MKKIIATIIICLIALSAVGCGSSASIYYTTVGNAIYYEINLSFSAEDAAALEESAEQAQTGYTLPKYFREFCDIAGNVDFVSSSSNDEGSVIKMQIVTSRSEASSDGEESLDPNFSVDVDRGLFVHEVTVTQSNPLVAYVDAYEQGSVGTVFYYIKNGAVNELGESVFPALDAAFPAVKDMNIDAFRLSFYMEKPMWYYGSDGELTEGLTDYVKWEITYGEADNQTVTYSYYSPNSLVWSITLALASVLLVTVLWLISKAVKKAPGTGKTRNHMTLNQEDERIIAAIREADERAKAQRQREQDAKNINPFED